MISLIKGHDDVTYGFDFDCVMVVAYFFALFCKFLLGLGKIIIISFRARSLFCVIPSKIKN